MSNGTTTRVVRVPSNPQVRAHRPGVGPALVTAANGPASSGSWMQDNWIKLAAALAGLALFASIFALALHRRPAAVAEGRPVAVPSAPAGVIDSVVGVPLDGAGSAVAGHAAPVVIDLFSDFSCPFCARFKNEQGDALIALAADPNISVRYHPVSFLDRSGDGSGWSTLAASAFLETAAREPAKAWAVSQALLDHQSDGLTGDAVVEMLNSEIGTNLPPMAEILESQRANVGGFMNNARELEVGHVPMILINGVEWDSQREPDLTAAVRRVAGN